MGAGTLSGVWELFLSATYIVTDNDADDDKNGFILLDTSSARTDKSMWELRASSPAEKAQWVSCGPCDLRRSTLKLRLLRGRLANCSALFMSRSGWLNTRWAQS